jgi:SNF2 family DNA or RNA helicase
MEEELFTLLDNGEKVNAPGVLAQRLRLRQLCLEPNLLASESEARISSPSAKTSAIIDMLEERGNDSTEGKTIVFTWFERYVRILEQEVKRTGISYATYTGQESSDDRIIIQKQFLEETNPRILIGTIGAMGLGLNLTAADVEIFPDWHYNPAVNEQAIYRAQGEGQTRPLHVIDMWAKGTIEDAVHRTLSIKQRDFRDVVELDTAAIQELRRMRGK